MKWIAIAGSWHKINSEIEIKIRQTVAEIFEAGNGIVSGGALNVDLVALDEAMKLNPEADRIKIFLPTTLEKYSEHYRKHAKLGNIASEQAEGLINQLTNLKCVNPEALVENPDTSFTEETKKAMYFDRISKIIEAADELVAFAVKTKPGEGLGTADTIEKARKKGIPVVEYKYDLSNNT